MTLGFNASPYAVEVNIVLILITLSSFFLLLFILKNVKKRGNDSTELYEKLKREIQFSVQPMSDIPLGVEEITELATEVWRIEQRLSKTTDKISDIHKKGLDNSIERLKRYLKKFDVEILDYSGQKYNDGFNFEILSREQDSSLEYPIIKETIEPTITCRGRVVKKAKVILASNEK
jgi:predicted amino acid-binding ACT domain protein